MGGPWRPAVLVRPVLWTGSRGGWWLAPSCIGQTCTLDWESWWVVVGAQLYWSDLYSGLGVVGGGNTGLQI